MSVFEVGISFSVFFGIFTVGSIFDIGISKYRNIDIGIRYFSTIALFEVSEYCVAYNVYVHGIGLRIHGIRNWPTTIYRLKNTVIPV